MRRAAAWAACGAFVGGVVLGAPAPPMSFEEIGERAGVRLVHTKRKFVGREKRDVLEMFTEGGAAVAVGDYNEDGFDDMFVTTSAEGQANRLLRNNGDWTFTDVAAIAGVQGGNDKRSIVADAVWLDYDNDGRLDLLVGRFGSPLLYRNQGPGKGGAHRFEEVSKSAGLTAFGNTLAIVAFDYDRDGWLDILFGNYFPAHNLLELKTSHVLPNNLDYADNGGGVTLWHNVPLPGKGAKRGFVEVTNKAGFSHHTGWSLDLGHGDVNNDGWQDVYIAGDYGTDRLFINKGDGTFDDVTEAAMGFDTKKGMNVDFGDYNRDGWLDIYVTNITDEYMRECNMLWHNNGDGTLIDLSKESGTCDTDWGWAAKFADFDNDGWEDIFAVNGLRSAGEQNYIPVLLEMIITPGVDFSDLHSYPDIGDMTWSGFQKQRMFRNRGDGTFKEIGGAAGVDNDLDGRGIGIADFDNDGRLDFYQTNSGQPALLYRGTTGKTGSWVQLNLEGTRSNRDAVGARVTLVAGGQSQIREVNCGNGYSSQSTMRLHFGLGEAKRVESIEILWPNGQVEKRSAKGSESVIPINSRHTLREGGGAVPR